MCRTVSFTIQDAPGFDVYFGDDLFVITVAWLSFAYYKTDLQRILGHAIIGASGIESLMDEADLRDGNLDQSQMIDAIRFGLKRYTEGNTNQNIDDFLSERGDLPDG